MRPEKFRGNVFVANLPKGFTDAQLAEAFDEYGIVISALLARDAKTGAPKNHGLVSIAPERAAAAAIAALNGKEVGGKRIEVRPADPEMSLTIPSRRPSRADAHSHAHAHPQPAAPAQPTFTVERRELRRWS
jgi:RNA recognition motif-containing protein